MAIYQDSDAGTSGGGAGVLAPPLPSLPDGRGPDKDVIAVTAIPAGRDLMLNIPTTTWPNPHDRDMVAIDVTRTEPPNNPPDAAFERLPTVALGPVADRPPTIQIPLPARFLGEDATPETPTPVWVRSVLYARGLNGLSSTVVRIFVDRTAPYQAKPLQTGTVPGVTPGPKSPPAVTFPNAPTVGTTIDDAWAAIEENKAGLKVLVGKTYPNARADDRLTLYAAGSRSDPPTVAPIHDDAIPVSGEVVIDMDKLKEVTTGRVHIWFRLTDHADNVSAWSTNYRNVLFQPLPVLAPPIVPLAQADGMIDLADVRRGVTVIVNRPLNTLNSDKASLKWGGQTAEDKEFLTAQSLTFTIPWSKLSAEYKDNQSGDDDVVPVTVKADLMRGGSSISTSQTVVRTDYSVVGAPYPENPDDPDKPPSEINEELKPLIVRGQPPVVDNTLGPQDANQTAKIIIDLTPVSGGVWPDPDPDGKDVVTVKYRGDAGEVVVVSESLTTEIVNTVIELPLPYSIVGPGGLGQKHIWWTLENPDRNNVQRAADTPITVNTLVINLEAPEFIRDPGDHQDFAIICTSLIRPSHVARFRIPPNDHFTLGMDITFNWRGWLDEAYANPSPSDTEFTATRKINANELLNGMIFDVGPYDPVLRNTPPPPDDPPDPAKYYSGYVKVWYSTPVVPTSGVTEKEINLVNGDFLYCETEPGWEP